jgi:hypothetical protein
MTNAVKGGVQFDANGARYTLIYSTNALCILEDTMQLSVNSVLALMSDPGKARVNDVRTLFWAGLQDHHPDLDQKSVGRIMDAVGGLMGTLDLMLKAVTMAFPQAAKGGADGARPLAGATHAGTGMIS